MTGNISFNSNNYPIQSPELQKRLQSAENFGAIDKERLKQDTVELQQKAAESQENNFFVKKAKGLKNDDNKKTVVATILAITAVVAGALLTNKFSSKFASAGFNVDKFLLESDNFFAKGYRKLGEALSSLKTKLFKKASNSKIIGETVNDLTDTFTNKKATQKWNLFRGYDKGAPGIFRLTPSETLKNAIQDVADKKGSFVKLVGDKADDLVELVEKEGTDPGEICEFLRKGMAEKFGCIKNGKIDGEKLNGVFEQLKKGNIDGVDVSEFTDVIMMEKGAKGGKKLFNIVSDWWPVRMIEKSVNGVKGLLGKEKNFKFGRGNLGDAMQKYCMANGHAAKTLPGKFIQAAPTITADSFHNFHNDKSGLGVFLGIGTIIPFMKDMIDAPKEKKVSTATNNVVGNALHWSLSMPFAFGATYGLASLKNLEGKSFITKGLKQVGKFFGMGLDKTIRNVNTGEIEKIVNKSKVAGPLGAVLRFVAVMFVFSPMVGKAIDKVTHKVFGKPYDRVEEQKAKALEEQKNTIIPELGITQGEFLQKVGNNQERMKALENQPELLQKMQENPKLLVDYLDGKDILNTSNQTNAVDNSLNQNQTNMIQPNSSNQTTKVDTATYIPSSDFLAKTSNYTDSQTKEINDVLARADKALERAQKYM